MMDSKYTFLQWAEQENIFSYYTQYRFTEMFNEMDIMFQGHGRSVAAFYKGYIVAVWICRRKSIVLIDYSFYVDMKSTVIQRKLHHEYKSCFSLDFSKTKSEYDNYEEGYTITQYNIWHVIDYLGRVRDKINNGFNRYSELLIKQDIEDENAGFLKVDINNAFSITELNELLEAYNDLYALLYYACINGIESMSSLQIDDMREKPNMIVESIHVGSYGLLMAVGEAVIVELLKEAILALLNGKDSIAEERKQELIAKAEADKKIRTNQTIMQLIDELNSVLERKANGGNQITQCYLENQMRMLMNTIERLQGTKHIDYVV